jgi:hypothetical protein
MQPNKYKLKLHECHEHKIRFVVSRADPRELLDCSEQTFHRIGCYYLVPPAATTAVRSAMNVHLRLMADEEKWAGSFPLWRRKNMKVSAKSSAGEVEAYAETKSCISAELRLPSQ